MQFRLDTKYILIKLRNLGKIISYSSFPIFMYFMAANSFNSFIASSLAIKITNPLTGSTVLKNSVVEITAEANDSSNISKVEFYANNKLIQGCSYTTPPYSCDWKVSAKPRLIFTLKAIAFDKLGHQTSDEVEVTSGVN